MDPLSENEEVLVTPDHHPARVDARPARVGEQRNEHLGHAAALGGRVDVPQDAPVKRLAAALHRTQQALVVLVREHRLKALQVQCANGHVRQGGHRRRSYARLTRRATTPLELGFETLRDLGPAVAISGSARASRWETPNTSSA